LIRTYIDSGVLIAAARGQGRLSQRALTVLADESRELVASDYVRLEVVPKAAYFKQQAELDFYESFFARTAVCVSFSSARWPALFAEACKSGLSGFDAIHVLLATIAGCVELVTTERPGKAIHRTSSIRVLSIAE
jgi:predicted nucleic acid-binding protein